MVGYLYNVYCDHFWSNYWKEHAVYGDNDETDELTDFSFTSSREIPIDTFLTKKNFWKYTWHRELIEPYHGQWINDIELSFDSDSMLFYRITAQYISDNYWTYPVFRKFRSKAENTYTHHFKFDPNSMSFINHKQDTVNILLDEKKIIIKYVFM